MGTLAPRQRRRSQSRGQRRAMEHPLAAGMELGALKSEALKPLAQL